MSAFMFMAVSGKNWPRFHVFRCWNKKKKTDGSATASLSLRRSGEDPPAISADGFSSCVKTGRRCW